jgi:hypothetical protein
MLLSFARMSLLKTLMLSLFSPDHGNNKDPIAVDVTEPLAQVLQDLPHLESLSVVPRDHTARRYQGWMVRSTKVLDALKHKRKLRVFNVKSTLDTLEKKRYFANEVLSKNTTLERVFLDGSDGKEDLVSGDVIQYQTTLNRCGRYKVIDPACSKAHFVQLANATRPSQRLNLDVTTVQYWLLLQLPALWS